MRRVILKIDCVGGHAGDTVSVSNNVAFGLVDSKKAKYVESEMKEVIVRPYLGESKAINTEKIQKKLRSRQRRRRV